MPSAVLLTCISSRRTNAGQRNLTAYGKIISVCNKYKII